MTRDELVTNLIAFSVGTASLRDVQRMAEAMLACDCRERDARDPRQADVFECRFCKKQVDYTKPYRSDAAGLWHWECGAQATPPAAAAAATSSPAEAPKEPAPISDADVERETKALWTACPYVTVDSRDLVRWMAWTKLEAEAKLRADMSAMDFLHENAARERDILRAKLAEAEVAIQDRDMWLRGAQQDVDGKRAMIEEYERECDAVRAKLAEERAELAEAKKVGCSLYDEMRGLEQQLAAARAPLTYGQVEAGERVIAGPWRGKRWRDLVVEIVDAVRGAPSEPAKSAPKRAWTEAERDAVARELPWTKSDSREWVARLESAWLAAAPPDESLKPEAGGP